MRCRAPATCPRPLARAPRPPGSPGEAAPSLPRRRPPAARRPRRPRSRVAGLPSSAATCAAIRSAVGVPRRSPSNPAIRRTITLQSCAAATCAGPRPVLGAARGRLQRGRQAPPSIHPRRERGYHMTEVVERPDRRADRRQPGGQILVELQRVDVLGVVVESYGRMPTSTCCVYAGMLPKSPVNRAGAHWRGAGARQTLPRPVPVACTGPRERTTIAGCVPPPPSRAGYPSCS